MKELARVYFKGLVLGSGIATALTLAFVIAYAADILTIDKDGAIRFSVSDTGKVTLDTNEPAEGDLRLTQRAADPTAPLAGDLWYNATGKAAKLSDGTTSLPVPGKFQRYSVAKSDGDYATTSTTFVDVPGLSLNFTTDYANQVILITFSGRGQSGTAGGAILVNATLDGTSLADGAQGFTAHKSDAAWSGGNLSFSLYYTVPAAGNHTVKVQIASNNASYTADLQAAAISFVPRLDVIKFF